MQEALIVNPYESGKVADVIHHALTMDPAEAEVRMSALRSRESVNDLDRWLKTFLKEIGNLDEGCFSCFSLLAFSFGVFPFGLSF